MMFDFNEYVRTHRTAEDCERGFSMPTLPKIKCTDGFSMSVQGGVSNYSSPRFNVLAYESAEVGFPSEKVDKLMPYAEDPESPTETVYGYVPVSIINAIVDDHGGMVDTK